MIFYYYWVMIRTIYFLAIVSLVSCVSKNQGNHEVKKTKPESFTEFANVDPSVRTRFADYLKEYFALNQSLIEDDLTKANLRAAVFSVVVMDFDVAKLSGEQLDFYYVHGSNLEAALDSLEVRVNIEDARADLATVSEEMYALVQAFHPHESTLYVQYCPMARSNKGAYWLSTTKELVNPYMGQIMLACGRTHETIN
jgi:membrane fusion protein, copper/silver efflux system